MSNFQSSVATQPAPAVVGDFGDHNPRAHLNAGPGALIAGASGLVIGRFAWLNGTNRTDGNGAPAELDNAGSGAPSGFVHRAQQGLNSAYLSAAGMTIPAGFPAGAFTSGSFWAKNVGASANTVGQKAFASNTDGSVKFGNAGASIAGYTETKWVAASVGGANELVKITTHV